MDPLHKELIVTFHSLMDNLGLQYDLEDLGDLAHADIYVEIFRTMFPMLGFNIMKIIGQDEPNQGARIQSLINILSTEILKLDLSHIQGYLVAKGDAKHILNFLQLLFEISKMFLQKKQIEEQQQESQQTTGRIKSKAQSGKQKSSISTAKASNSTEFDAGYHKQSAGRHDSQDIPQEEDEEEDREQDSMIDLLQADSYTEEIADILNRASSKQQNSGRQQEAVEHRQPYGSAGRSENVSRISEVSKSKESSEYDRNYRNVSNRPQRGIGAMSSATKSSKKRSQSHEDNNRDVPYYEDDEGEEEDNAEPWDYNNELEEQERIYRKLQGDAQFLAGDQEEEEEEEGEGVPHYSSKQQPMGHQRHIEEQVQEEDYEQAEGYDDEMERKINMMQSKGVEYQSSNQKAKRQKKKGKKKNQNQLYAPGLYPKEQVSNTEQQVQHRKSGKSEVKARIKGRPKTAQTRPKTAGLFHSKSKKNLETAEELQESQATDQYQGDHEEEVIAQMQEQEANQEQYADEEGKEIPDSYQERDGEMQNIPISEEDLIHQVLTENIKNVRENLKGMRENLVPDDEPSTKELILQQKNNYKSYLNGYLKDHQTKQNKASQQRLLKEKNFIHTVKVQAMNDEKLSQELEGQQRSVMLKMRDEKINYLRKIHKLVFELEKKKIIEDKKQYMEMRKMKNGHTRCIVESIQNMYKNKLDMLREKQLNDNQERQLVEGAQRKLMRDLEQELKQDKMKEIETLKNKWNSQREKVQIAVKDNGQLEHQIAQVYKRLA